MPRENSFSDSDGRSLTPDLELPPAQPHVTTTTVQTSSPIPQVIAVEPTGRRSTTSAPPALHNNTQPLVHPSLKASNPRDRFRASVRKVIQLHRTSAFLSRRGGIGAEPGIDPRRESAYINYGHVRQNCLIEVVDYSAVRSSFGRMNNTTFINMMNDKAASEREPWVKVRWINIGGISWDVLSALAIKYDLHPLALEDVLHQQRSHARSKADYYHKHLFLRILCHALADENEFTVETDIPVTDLPRSSSPEPMGMEDEMGVTNLGVDESEGDEERTMFGGSAPNSGPPTTRGKFGMVKRRAWGAPWSKDVESAPTDLLNKTIIPTSSTARREKRAQEELTIKELKKGERVNVQILPMYIFLLRDGTIISIHPTPNLEYTAPITNRLRQRDTGLRATADPSLLVQSLLDLIVDSALEVIDEYHSKIRKMEYDILLKPRMKTVRYLHILSGDLILHKRTLGPIKTVIYGLRRYDLDRCAALADTSMLESGVKIEGFMSHKAKIYLADVHDHMEHILTSLDMFAGISENLINYAFNMASYDMNEVMRRLTLATIIFLPLTLLTGYFGMNFDFMWSIQGHSDVVFWAIALPVMAILLPVFLRNDIVRLTHYLMKKMFVKQAEKQRTSKLV